MVSRAILRVALASAIATPVVIADDLQRAWEMIRPVIHASNEQKMAAMRSASLIFVVKIQSMDLYSEPRQVEKPAAGGPMIPMIPLHLARISAKPLLFLHGRTTGPSEFYSWVWASGKHGGARLFHPTPDSVHVLFLTTDAGYLRTVGDYPSYDVQLPQQSVQNFIASWEAGVLRGADILERIAAIRLKSELERLDEKEAQSYWLNTPELIELTSQPFITIQLSGLCASLTNPAGRARACAEYAEQLAQQ
jgi:hypothetical protein